MHSLIRRKSTPVIGFCLRSFETARNPFYQGKGRQKTRINMNSPRMTLFRRMRRARRGTPFNWFQIAEKFRNKLELWHSEKPTRSWQHRRRLRFTFISLTFLRIHCYLLELNTRFMLRRRTKAFSFRWRKEKIMKLKHGERRGKIVNSKDIYRKRNLFP